MSWKTPITLAVLLVVLLGAAFYGWRTIISPAQDDDEPTPTDQARCDETETFKPGQVVRSRDILVNVYNAGTISGLAGDTLDELASRGFEAGKADNAPSGIGAENVSIIATDKRSPAVQLVASQFKGEVRIIKGDDIAPGVDIIVGNDFKKIDKQAKKSYKVKEKVTTCVAATGTASALAR